MRRGLRLYSEYDSCGNCHASSGGWQAHFLRKAVRVEFGVRAEDCAIGLFAPDSSIKWATIAVLRRFTKFLKARSIATNCVRFRSTRK